MAVMSEKSAKGTLDRRLLYKAVSRDFAPNKQNGDTCGGRSLGTRQDMRLWFREN